MKLAKKTLAEARGVSGDWTIYLMGFTGKRIKVNILGEIPEFLFSRLIKAVKHNKFDKIANC